MLNRKNYGLRHLAVVVTCFLVFFGILVSQDVAGDGIDDLDGALDRIEKTDGDSAGDSPPGPDYADDYEDLFEEIAAEDFEKMVQAAATRRLMIEREIFIDELKQDELFEKLEVEKAAKLVRDSARNTRADNIERICDAAGLVDDIFGSALQLYKEGKYKETISGLEDFINLQDTTYLSAAMQLVHARSLRKTGRGYEAVEAYRNILINLPDRVSFAAASAREAAETYMDMRRGSLALRMYSYYLYNYNLTISTKELNEVWDSVEKLKEIYKAPMESLSRMMKDVHERLKKEDAGSKTLEKEEEIVALLEDLIKSAEEQQQSQGGGRQKKQASKNKKQGAKSDREKSGASAKKSDPQGMRNDPKTGAKVSALVPGSVSRPTKMSEKFEGDDSGKWADLPPRQRQKIREMLKRKISGRWGGLIREYHEKMAEEE